MSRQAINEVLVYLRHLITPRFDYGAVVRANSIEDPKPDSLHEDQLVARIAKAYRAACEDDQLATEPYQAGGYWTSYTKGVSPSIKAALEDDVPALRDLLRNFLNGPSSKGMYNYRILEGWTPSVVNNINLWLNDAESYLERGNFSFDDLIGAPTFGAPTTFVVGGKRIMWSAPNHRFQALQTRDILKDTPKPTVLEIGGGFGGMASFLLDDGIATYINLDLPEQLINASYYLGMANPDRNLVLYGEGNIPSDFSDIEGIFLLPNFCLPKLGEMSVDATVNFISLSEMPRLTVDEYIRQIMRVTRTFFYHKNSNVALDRKTHTEVPASKFNIDNNLFKNIAWRESDVLKINATRYVEALYQRVDSRTQANKDRAF